MKLLVSIIYRKDKIMKRYIRSSFEIDTIGYEYGYYNDTAKDRIHFTDKYRKQGYTDIKVKRVQTDTPGLKMYEISGRKADK